MAQNNNSRVYKVRRGSRITNPADAHRAPLPPEFCKKLIQSAYRLERKSKQIRRYRRKGNERPRAGMLGGDSGIKVFKALLLFAQRGDFSPFHDAIARVADVSTRTVCNALTALRRAGLIQWINRCYHKQIGGAWRMAQDSNLYAMLRLDHWGADARIVLDGGVPGAASDAGAPPASSPRPPPAILPAIAPDATQRNVRDQLRRKLAELDERIARGDEKAVWPAAVIRRALAKGDGE